MCDERTLREMEEYLHGTDSNLTRRHFGALVIGAGVAATLPRAANAMDVTDAMIEVTTPDGTAEAYFVHPSEGKHPGVLVWPDAYGLRASFRLMARRLAESGYVVLVPNQYYRSTKLPALPGPLDMQDPKIRERWSVLRAPLTAEAVTRDALAFVGYLDSQESVDGSRKMGSIGYCMGGAMTLRTAAALPDRIGAGASFHGGGLVTDKPDSPHRLVATIKVPEVPVPGRGFRGFRGIVARRAPCSRALPLAPKTDSHSPGEHGRLRPPHHGTSGLAAQGWKKNARRQVGPCIVRRIKSGSRGQRSLLARSSRLKARSNTTTPSRY